jgi:hypothetical protein
MKKVVRVMGIAGLAPAAGLIAPAAAAAAPAVTHPAKTGTKTVSLRPVNRAVPDAGCTGNKRVSTNTLPIVASWMWLFHTSFSTSQCIGTVAGSTISTSNSQFRVRVWHGKKLESGHVVGVRKGGAGLIASTAFHERFADPVKVCDTWGLHGDWSHGLCITVG